MTCFTYSIGVLQVLQFSAVHIWQLSFDIIYGWNRFYYTILSRHLDITIEGLCLFEVLFGLQAVNDLR